MTTTQTRLATPPDVADLASVDPQLHAFLTDGSIGTVPDPYPLLARLRRDWPVLGAFGAVTVFRHEDVAAVLQHPRMSADDRNSTAHRSLADAGRLAPAYLSQLDDRSFLHRDPPEHTRLRRLVATRFTPQRTEALRGFVHRFVDDVLDTAAQHGRLELVDELTHPLPIAVVCDLLGIPAEDRPFVASWPRTQLCCSFEPATLQTAVELDQTADTGRQAEADRIQQQLTDYFALLIDRRRVEPGDDVVSALIAAEIDGGRLTGEEINATLRLLFVAGYENVVNLLGHGTLALLRHPGQWRALREDPSLATGAVHEALRYDAPFQFTRRVALADLDIGGYRIERGQHVLAFIAAANRDPDHFPDPDRFDIQRGDNRHLAFGTGIHACLGGPLARMQAEIVFTSLTRRLIDPQIEAEPRYRTDVFRSLAELPIAFSGMRPAHAQ